MKNSLFNRFIILEEVGEGKSAKVYKAKDIKYNRLVAIKALLKSSLNTRHRIRRVECECSIMMNLNHPNILKLHYVLEDDQYLFLITPYAQGGDLLDYMLSHNPARIHEDEMRPLFFQTVSAMLYAHSKQICHRDLKPENILLTADKKDVWVADWGFSERFTEDTQLRERCGTTLYAPPEMFLGQQYRGPETDTWSLGVVLYAMRTGKFPFGGKTNEEIAMNVVGSVLRFPSDVSVRLRELITAMLAKRGSKRIRLQQVMDHPWLSPLNDPASSLMLSHKRYMQAGESSSSSADGEKKQREREREKEKERGREREKEKEGEKEKKGEDDAEKGKEKEGSKEEEKDEGKEEKEQKEKEQKEAKEEEEKEKEAKEKEKEEKEKQKEKEEAEEEAEKKKQEKEETKEEKESEAKPEEGKKVKEKKGDEEKKGKGKEKKGEEGDGGKKKKEKREKKEKDTKSRSQTVSGAESRERTKKEGKEKRKKKESKEEGDEASKEKKEKREKKEKKKSKEKEEKKEEGAEEKKEKKEKKSKEKKEPEQVADQEAKSPEKKKEKKSKDKKRGEDEEKKKKKKAD